jgi:hypothetical protein
VPRVPSGVGVLVEVSDFLLVDGDGEDLFFLELVRVVLIALDHEESLVLMQPDFGGYEEDFVEEVLLLEDLLIVWLFELLALVHV